MTGTAVPLLKPPASKAQGLAHTRGQINVLLAQVPGESWAGRALCKQSNRFPHLAAAADSRESSSKVLGTAAVSQSEVTALLQ